MPLFPALMRILTLVYKEILAVWRDKKSRTVLVVPPFTQLLIFSFAATLDVKNVSIGILNQDNGKPAYELTQRFVGSPTFTHITYLNSPNEVAPYLENQNGTMVVWLDQQFSRNLLSSKRAQVQLLLDGRKSNTSQIVNGYASQIVEQFNREFANNNQIPLQNTRIISRNWFNPNLLYTWFVVPGLTGILTMLVGLVVTALSVARERELGTFDQLLVSPMSPLEILIGKTIPAIVIGMVEGTIIITAAILFFRIPLTGNLAFLYMNMFVFICCIVGVGLFISSLCSTQQQAILGTFIFMSPAVALSGFATPIETMPDWLQMLTHLNPLRYYLVVAKGIFLKEMPFDIVLSNTWPLALIAIFNMSGAAWFFRRGLD